MNNLVGHTHMLMLIIAMKIKLSMLWNQKVMRHNLMRHKVLEPKFKQLLDKVLEPKLNMLQFNKVCIKSMKLGYR